eukprot:GHVU01131796.1.p1 GENE.GHVU01131796.1~~GHVU01131796.1.p1  ORF type:complete len:118 (-),score=16.50 GHVU01131796.1:101-454(-)
MWCLWCVYPSRPHPCCCCCTHIGWKKEEVTYYLMAAGPNWEDRVLKEVKTPKKFYGKKLAKNIIKDNNLPTNAMLISPDCNNYWIDISQRSDNIGPDWPPRYMNIVALTDKGERENE